ncbi:MAG TPA: sigma-70 family RNA polymerase sigma factor [Pyrinomonadaceae bacterium]|jgi:RNA polymerase sigma-70 factor (ECF subfamily)|nr:sigma-70 family RNA polymerase sigma factor [Pyrinomonadaceae bacterium]
MGLTAEELGRTVRDGAARLVARASDARGLDAAALEPRVGKVVGKYVLRDEPEASAARVSKFIDGLRADDLCLVVACERADERAWDDLINSFRATVLSAARGASANEDAAEELAQSIWAELYGLRATSGGGAAGKLAYYSGCGSLGGWLRAVVSQLAVDRHRKSSRLVQTEEDADFDRLAHEPAAGDDGFQVAATPDPERALAHAESTGALHEALARVVAGLSAEDRLLIKLYYFDGLRLREAGAVLGVHEATASRRLTRLHAEVRERVEKILTAERGWTREEARRALAESAERTDADLAPLLATEPAAEQREELYE